MIWFVLHLTAKGLGFYPNAKVGIVKEKHSTEPLVSVFWKEGLIIGEFEDDLEVISESRR